MPLLRRCAAYSRYPLEWHSLAEQWNQLCFIEAACNLGRHVEWLFLAGYCRPFLRARVCTRALYASLSDLYHDFSRILRSLGIGVRRVGPAASSVIFKSSNQEATSFIKEKTPAHPDWRSALGPTRIKTDS